MASRRSKKNASAEVDKGVDNLKRGSSELSDDEDKSKKAVEEFEDEPKSEAKTTARVLRSKGRNVSKENSEGKSPEAGQQNRVSPRLSPPVKRKRTKSDTSADTGKSKLLRMAEEEEEEDDEDEDDEMEGDDEYEEEDEEYEVDNEESLAKKKSSPTKVKSSITKGKNLDVSSDEAMDREDSPLLNTKDSRNSVLELEYDEFSDETSPLELSGTPKARKSLRNVSVVKPNQQESKKPVTIQVKKVVKGANEGEIEVVTSYEDPPEEGARRGTMLKDLKYNRNFSIGEEHGAENDGAEAEHGESKDTPSPEKITRTYPGPTKRVNTVTKTGGRKYMILDKATIKGMMEKGLIQAINKHGTSQQNVTYRAILPKAGPSILRRIGSPAVRLKTSSIQTAAVLNKSTDKNSLLLSSSESPITTTVPVKVPVSIISTSSSSTTTMSDIPSTGIRLHVPSTSGVVKTSAGVNQLITAPVFVKSSISSAVSSSSGMQVVNLPSNILSQIQKGLSLAVSSASSGEKKFLGPAQGEKYSSKSKFIVSAGSIKPAPLDKDPDDPEFVNNASDSGEEEGAKGEGKYGIPTGVCKVLKSMKMYQYLDKSENGVSKGMHSTAKGSHNVRWVAVPKIPGEEIPDFGPKIQQCAPPILPISVPLIAKELVEDGTQETGRNRKGLRRLLKDMKLQHARLIGKHRTRFSRLQKKYSELEKDFKEVEDVGTPQQLVRDCKKYLEAEHALFMESQMFWKNCDGKGNRYSKRFILLMLDLYHKSPAGYRYLKTVFTLPSVKLLLKLESRGFGAREQTEEPVSLEADEGNAQMPVDGSSRSGDEDDMDTSGESPMTTVTIKTEVPVIDRNPLTLSTDSKDWFKSVMKFSESVPSTSEQTVFLSSSVKESLLSKKRADEDEEDSSLHHANSDNLELNEVGSSMTTFDNISKKVVVLPDNETLNKQEITIQWDESWGPL